MDIMTMNKKKIIVTGVCGLIGSHLAERLVKDGQSVIGIDNLSFGTLDNIKMIKSDNFEFIEFDLKNPLDEIIEDKDIDMIYHLAAYKKAPPATSTYRHGTKNLLNTSCNDVMINNTKMMENIINFIQKSDNRIKLVYTSSSDVYHNHQDFKESSSVVFGPPTIERYSYALSKWFEEQLAMNAFNEGSIDVSVARLFGCYSERSKIGWSAGHILIFIDKALKNQDIEIHGDGLQTRSMSHALDIVEGLVGMRSNFNAINGEIINLGSQEELTVLQAANLIIRMAKSESKIKFIDSEKVHGAGYKDIQRRFADTSKAEELLDYKTTIRLEDGIADILNKFKNEDSSYYSS